ncbi:hypothetical protein [Nesterenkonia sp. HG001]|uniref:hypothetical protein n=1 Tax=unclassified Nesterenkonia TaxID=2629769 RepID=UPI002AC4BCC7|nr:hypothetical protein [Nesterenkonia sp. HG001]MDZ5076715.1 hypothetical protein [Nesterenkonia sp. HG001]
MPDLRPCRYCGALIDWGRRLDHLRWHATIDPELETPTSSHGLWASSGEWIETGP